MKPVTLVTMIVILGIVWGGVIFFIIKAYRSEKRKITNGKDESNINT
jgi:heme/copper-type cytochrome/quinol oxidase subunit 2